MKERLAVAELILICPVVDTTARSQDEIREQLSGFTSGG